MHAYLLATAMGAALGLVPCHAAAAVLHPYSQISSDTVHLSDLFGDLANTADRALGAAPAPGARIVVSCHRSLSGTPRSRREGRSSTYDLSLSVRRR